MGISNKREKPQPTKKYDDVPEVKLTQKEEDFLQKKFDKHAKVLQWVGAGSTYYIHIGSAILKHTDTCCLFNLLAKSYKEDKTKRIW